MYERIVLNIQKDFLERLSTQQTKLSSCFLDRPNCEKNLIQLSTQELKSYLILSGNLRDVLKESSYGSDLLGISYLLQILVRTNQLYRDSENLEFSEPKDLMPMLVQDTMAYIEEHLAEEITLADLSAAFFHNGTYISRRFKAVTGLTISEYILYKRIGRAQKYLAEGVPLTEASLMSGFNNYSNFSRSFTKQVGCSPKKYQNAYKKNKT